MSTPIPMLNGLVPTDHASPTSGKLDAVADALSKWADELMEGRQVEPSVTGLRLMAIAVRSVVTQPDQESELVAIDLTAPALPRDQLSPEARRDWVLNGPPRIWMETDCRGPWFVKPAQPSREYIRADLASAGMVSVEEAALPNGEGSVTVGVDLAASPDRSVVTLFDPTQAAIDLLDERQRQVHAEGWTPEHDDTYDRDELSAAAACYAHFGWVRPTTGAAPTEWPWSNDWWKPTDRRRDLVKAGALILAEIERLDRAALRALAGEGGR